MIAQLKKLFLIINNSLQDDVLLIFQYTGVPFCDEEIYFVAFLMKDSPKIKLSEYE